VTNRELDSVTQRLVHRLARRLNLTRLDLTRRFDMTRSLVAGGLVGRGLLFARGLFSRLVGGSFVVNNSKSRSLWRRVFDEDIESTFYSIESRVHTVH
jgi:hypothetical protein